MIWKSALPFGSEISDSPAADSGILPLRNCRVATEEASRQGFLPPRGRERKIFLFGCAQMKTDLGSVACDLQSEDSFSGDYS